MEIIYCPWEPATNLFSSSNVPLLIHYSHFIALFSAMAIALLVFLNNPKETVSRLFLLFSTLFSVWALLDIVLWATNDPAIVMFSWAMQVLIEPLTFAVAFFLFFFHLYKKFPKFSINLGIVLLLTPLVLFLPTQINLESLLLSACESVEGPIAKYYTYFLNVLFMASIIILGIRKLPKITSPKQKNSSTLFFFGLLTFLLAFTSGNIISSFTDDWTISQYGLFGMPIFASIMAYSIVRHSAFRIQVAGAQILVVTLAVFVGSLLFVETELMRLVAAPTFIFSLAAGFLLVRSVRQEFIQKNQLEELTTQLEKANVRLKAVDKQKSEFVSIASHQLRSPLTAIRGYASLLREESFGKLPPKAIEPIQRIEESSKLMALAIEDYLNVSRIESGNMKYHLSDFNLRDETEHVCDDMRADAIKHGLVILFRTHLSSTGIIHADIGKTIQIVQNLIHNAVKYTQEGTITVVVRDDRQRKKIFVDVTDTGIGMSQDTIHALFQKFSRAENANSVNILGTGLGLYVADKMAEAMGGDIEAYSQGDGKGSRFTLTMPLEM